MNRALTNWIRFFLDECLPPLVRDNPHVMRPFYRLAYGGKDLGRIMNFKRLVHDLSPAEYRAFYESLDSSISRRRPTDLSAASSAFILRAIDSGCKTLLDVGCGCGWLLRLIARRRPGIALTGGDIMPAPLPADAPYRYVRQDIHALPFADGAFDVVTCCHTLEHALHLRRAVRELERVCRRKLIIVVPCQRYYYHTLDEHINFFPARDQLISLMEIDNDHLETCERRRGDWHLVIRCGAAA
ncbi:MAG: class I SAM-dependent methyltransferase [Deltaproteobacteria bacterium]|nr:class I SAM-dependent methyltransferase [Candidatus Anaeroferrophillacea bacterium]